MLSSRVLVGALVCACWSTFAQAQELSGVQWSPARFAPVSDDIALVLSTMRKGNPQTGLPAANRTDAFTLTAGGHIVKATAWIRGLDYRIDEQLGDVPARMGRENGTYWRANNAGTTHSVYVDVAGDDADRWPVSVLGFDAAQCELLGTSEKPRPSWVLIDREPASFPRWIYVDRTNGDIVREVSREGTRVVTYDFSDFADDDGIRRAHGWHISGDGGDAMVVLDSTMAGGDGALASRPAQGPPEFSAPEKARKLSASFNTIDQMALDFRIDGRHASGVLDTGTAGILLGPANLGKAGGTPLFDHGNASSAVIDDAVAHPMPFTLVKGFDGIVGYDFLRGRIIHIDYRGKTVEMLPRDGFTPPTDAFALPTDWSEGMPLIRVQVGNATSGRFILDTGSYRVLLSHRFAVAAGVDHLADAGRRETETYNEGSMSVAQSTLPEIDVGQFRFADVPAMLELPDGANLDIPLDGIIGTEQMQKFEWWFDADGNTTWYRLRV